jgi:hypothetical protein
MKTAEHIPFSILVEYAADRFVPAPLLDLVEDHLLLCRRCRGIVTQLDRAGSIGIPVHVSHSPQSEPIQLWIQKSRSGHWIRAFMGYHFDGGCAFSSIEPARTITIDLFDQAYRRDGNGSGPNYRLPVFSNSFNC